MKAVLFDLDGVLLDSEIPAFTMLRDSFLSVGIDVSLEELLSHVGKTSLAIAETILRKFNSALCAEEMLRIHRDRGNFYAVSPAVRPYDGELELLRLLHDSGIQMAVVSSTSTISVVSALNRMRVLRYMDAVVCADMLTKPKPDPEGYVKAAALLGRNPEECLVIEDSPNGIQAGKAAGMFVIGFKGSEHRQDTTDADMEVNNYRELINHPIIREIRKD